MLDIVNDKMSQRVVSKKVKCFLITIVSITFRQLDINVLRILRLVLSRNLLYISIGIDILGFSQYELYISKEIDILRFSS